MSNEELNQDLSDLQRAEATVEFMNLFRQMLNEARFFSHDERSLRGYLIEDIEKKKLKAEEFLKTCHLTNRQIEITKQTAIDFANWLDKLTPSQRTSVWSKNGEHQGLFTMDNDQLFERFEKQYTERAKWQQERMYSEEDRLKRSDKLWKKLVKELSVLNDNNYAARRLFDYIERHYRQPPQQPPITNN